MANRLHAPRARHLPAPRPLLLLAATLLASALAACYAPRPPRRAGDTVEPETGPVPVRLVRGDGCCQGEPGRLAALLEDALSRQPGLRLITESGAPASQTKEPALDVRTRELRATLKRVRALYLSMKMEVVRQELRRALAIVKEVSGAYLEAEEIATVHLYLAAVSQATGQSAQLRQHAEAAVRFFPDLKPDPDVFSPPVREEVERARQSRRTVDVSIVSEPAGAKVFWDGSPRGETPAELPAQAIGEHYLRLQLGDHQPWHDTIVLSSASAQLQVKLKPLGAGPASLIAADLVTLSPAVDGKGLRVGVQPRSGSPRTAALASGATAMDAEKVVVQLFVTHVDGEPKTAPPPPKRRTHLQRYWWAYVAVGAAAVILAVAIPVALTSSGSSGDGRPVKLPLP